MTGTDPIIGPARRLLEHRRRAMVFTGAGISTESGIPDFRSPGGIWSRMQPIDFRDFVRSEEMRREAWRRKLVIDRDFQQAAPNRGHRALAALHARGVLTDIITQNIDGLHQASGVPAEQVIELHGNGTYAACLSCGTRHEIDWVREVIDAVRALTAAAGVLAEGRHAGRTGLEHDRDEIGQLARAFDTLAAQTGVDTVSIANNAQLAGANIRFLSKNALGVTLDTPLSTLAG